jgi:general secretion pathway protein J
MTVLAITTFAGRLGRTATRRLRPVVSWPNGFTLLELIIALTVFGVLLVTLSQGMHFGLLAWGSEITQITANDDFGTFDDTFRHVIESMDAGDDLDPAPFLGRTDRLACITELPVATGSLPSRHMRAELLVDSAHRLVLRWQPYLHAKRIAPTTTTDTELVRGVAGVKLEYWGPGRGWTPAWDSPELPKLVRMHVRFSAGDPRHWPDIVAAPRLDRS